MSLISRVEAHLEQEGTRREIQQFCEDTVPLFADLTMEQLSAPEGENMDNRHEWYEAHMRFVGLIENKLDAALAAEGADRAQFDAEAEAVLQDTTRASYENMFLKLLLHSA